MYVPPRRKAENDTYIITETYGVVNKKVSGDQSRSGVSSTRTVENPRSSTAAWISSPL